MTGRVYIIGAGPGDPSLITLCGLPSASKVVGIGPVTTDALKTLGMTPDVEAHPHTAHGLLRATLDVLSAGVLPEWLDLTLTQPRDKFD